MNTQDATYVHPYLLFAEPVEILLQVCLFYTFLRSLFALSHTRNLLCGEDLVPVENQLLSNGAFCYNIGTNNE